MGDEARGQIEQGCGDFSGWNGLAGVTTSSGQAEDKPLGYPSRRCQGSWGGWGPVELLAPFRASPLSSLLLLGVPFGSLLHPACAELKTFSLCPLYRLFTQQCARRGGHAGCSEHRCHLELHLPRLRCECESGAAPEGCLCAL